MDEHFADLFARYEAFAPHRSAQSSGAEAIGDLSLASSAAAAS